MKILESFVFNQIDEEVLKSEVKQLQDEYSEISSYELCDVLITKTSVSAAISGGITGGIPWPLNLLFAVPDFLLLLLFQTKMIMKIAILAGKEPIDDSRFNEVLACMGVSAGAVAGTIGIRKIIENGVSPFLLKMILKQFTKSCSSKLFPFLGAIAGTAINISAVIGAGYVARELYFPKDAEITGYKSDKEDESEDDKEGKKEDKDSDDSKEDDSEEVEEEKEFENEDEAEEKEKQDSEDNSEESDEDEESEDEESDEDEESEDDEEESADSEEEEESEDDDDSEGEEESDEDETPEDKSKEEEKDKKATYLEEAEDVHFENEPKKDK